MRDKTQRTRFFSFALTKSADGAFDESLGAPIKKLERQDVIEYFDTDYIRFIQGAGVRDGRIYSLEGFTASEKNPPAIRIINAPEQKEELYVRFSSLGSDVEPELIDFSDNECYYLDSHGSVYNIEF